MDGIDRLYSGVGWGKMRVIWSGRGGEFTQPRAILSRNSVDTTEVGTTCPFQKLAKPESTSCFTCTSVYLGNFLGITGNPTVTEIQPSDNLKSDWRRHLGGK